MKKNSKSRSPVCTRSSISILGDNQADYVNESSSVASTTTKGKESIAGRLKRKILSNITNSQFSKHAAGFLEHPTFKRKKSSDVTLTQDSNSSVDVNVNSTSIDNGTIKNPLSQKLSAPQLPKGVMQLRSSSSSSSVAPSTLSSMASASLSSSSSSPQRKLQSMTLESNVTAAESTTAKKKVSSSGRKKRSSSMSNSPLSASKSDKQGGQNKSATSAAKKAKADDLAIAAEGVVATKIATSVSDEGALPNSNTCSSSTTCTFKPIQEGDCPKPSNDRENMSSSLSVESLKGSGSVALSVRPSPLKCMGGSNNHMLASLAKNINSREQMCQLLSASPQTAFQKAPSSSSAGGNSIIIRNESSISNYGRSSSTTSTSSTFYAVSSDKRNSPESNPLLTPTELLPFKSAWCVTISVVPLTITTPQRNVVNIDVVYSHLPEFAAHYSIDMYDYFNIVEDEYRPDHQYLFAQTAINAEQRAYLVNAMISISRVQYYAPSTVYLAVNIVDRYLSLTTERVQPVELLLIGVTSLMIAFKHEESGCFRFDRMVRCVCSAEQAPRTQQQMVQLETKILTAVDFRITLPTLSQLAVCIARCICERSLLEYSMLNYLPSLIAASAVAMTRAIISGTSVRLTPDSPCEQDPWTATLDYYTGYNQEDLTFCIRELQYILAIETVNRAIVYCSKVLLEKARSESSVTTTTAATESSSTSLSLSSKRRQQNEQEEARIRKQEEIQKYESYLPSILAFGKYRTFKIYNPSCTQHSNHGVLFNRTAAQRRDEDRISAEAATLLDMWNQRQRNAPDTTSDNIPSSSSSSSSSPLCVSNETLQQMHSQSRHPPIYDAVKIRFSPIYHHIVTFPPNP
eukprot:gene28125-37021_t